MNATGYSQDRTQLLFAGQRSMHVLIRGVLRLAATSIVLAGFLSARGQVTVTANATGRQTVTAHSADQKFRLVIEDTEGASLTGIGFDNDDKTAPKLDATLVTGEGEKERTLWRTKIPGQIYQFMDGDSVLVSPKGDFFVVSADNWNGDGIRIFSERAVKAVELPKTAEDEFPMYARLIELDKIGSEDVVRIWDSKSDRWVAFKAPSGQKIAITPDLTTRWNDAMRRKILDLLNRQAKEELRDRIEEAVPKLGRLTAMMVSDQPSQQVNDTHYAFLIARRQSEDRKIFEAMLHKQKRPQMQHYRGFICGTGRTWRDSYRFSQSDYERERADAFLARWDGQGNREKFFSTYLEKPYQLARIEGGVKLAAPILTNAGKVHIHLIPVGKESTRWTNDVGAAYLECDLPNAIWPSRAIWWMKSNTRSPQFGRGSIF
jgi:hypothetical protein